MAYLLEISEKLDAKFKKLAKKSRKQMEAIDAKVKQILENPYHFKPLKGDMHGSRRVHIEKSFILTYEIDEQGKTVKLLDYDHHDKVY